LISKGGASKVMREIHTWGDDCWNSSEWLVPNHVTCTVKGL